MKLTLYTPPFELAGDTQADLAGEAKPWVSIQVSKEEFLVFSSVTLSRRLTPLVGLSCSQPKFDISTEGLVTMTLCIKSSSCSWLTSSDSEPYRE